METDRVDSTGLGYNNGLPVFTSLLFISNTVMDAAAAVVKFVPLTLPLPMGGVWRQPVCTRHSYVVPGNRPVTVRHDDFL